jgi:hypothetical protein
MKTDLQISVLRHLLALQAKIDKLETRIDNLSLQSKLV